MTSKVSLLLLTVCLYGCVGTKAGGYRVFDEDLQRLIGVLYKKAYVFNLGYLKEMSPQKITPLPPNREVREFYFEHSKDDGSGVCTVYIVIDKEMSAIVEASSGGNGCWRVY